MKLSKKSCRCCNGTGVELDQASLGKQMRELRIKAGKSQKEVAITLDFTACYLSDLERGNRRWTPELIERYKTAINSK